MSCTNRSSCNRNSTEPISPPSTAANLLISSEACSCASASRHSDSSATGAWHQAAYSCLKSSAPSAAAAALGASALLPLSFSSDMAARRDSRSSRSAGEEWRMPLSVCTISAQKGRSVEETTNEANSTYTRLGSSSTVSSLRMRGARASSKEGESAKRPITFPRAVAKYSVCAARRATTSMSRKTTSSASSPSESSSAGHSASAWRSSAAGRCRSNMAIHWKAVTRVRTASARMCCTNVARMACISKSASVDE
mmetsp:Transcript_1358/g.3513  ORF Transcript_1358/g.3513 Transcript_1358/m.3513 type:complete len:253 (-) Transcript_1358:1000-1758(-)